MICWVVQNLGLPDWPEESPPLDEVELDPPRVEMTAASLSFNSTCRCLRFNLSVLPLSSIRHHSTAGNAGITNVSALRLTYRTIFFQSTRVGTLIRMAYLGGITSATCFAEAATLYASEVNTRMIVSTEDPSTHCLVPPSELMCPSAPGLWLGRCTVQMALLCIQRSHTLS